MLIYIILFFVVLFLSFKIKKGKMTFVDYLLLGIIVLVSALRIVGIDYYMYLSLFNLLRENASLASRTGIGYAYFSYFVKFYLHFDFQFIIVLFSTLTNIIIYKFFKSFSKNPGLSILLFISFGFYTTSFNMFRQSLSLAFVLLGFKLFTDSKKIWCYLFYFLAFMLHSSSILPICIYMVLWHYKDKKINFKIMFLISLFILILYDKLFPLVLSYFDSFSLYLNYDSAPGIGTILMILVYLFIFVFMINRNVDIIYKYRNNYFFYNLFLIGTSIMLLEFKNFLFFRFAFYFTIMISIVFVDYYESTNFKNNKFLKLVLIICLFIYYMVYINSFDGVVPYLSIFS